MSKLSQSKVEQATREIARIASVMFDGELCGKIVTQRSWQWFANFDPDDKWSAMDNYDLEHAPFIAAKHTLMRLERLAPPGLKVGCSLWLAIPTLPGKVTCVIHNAGPDRFQGFGTLQLDLTPQMQTALTGTPVDVPADKAGIFTVLAPVRDSLKDVTGLIEVSAAQADSIIPW